MPNKGTIIQMTKEDDVQETNDITKEEAQIRKRTGLPSAAMSLLSCLEGLEPESSHSRASGKTCLFTNSRTTFLQSRLATDNLYAPISAMFIGVIGRFGISHNAWVFGKRHIGKGGKVCL